MGNVSKEHEREYNRQYYAEHAEEFRPKAKERQRQIRAGEHTPTQRELITPVEKYHRHKRRLLDYRIELRRRAFEALGGAICNRCGFTDERALQVDHRNGGGNQELKKIGWAAVMRKAIKSPADYQVLCANCNWIKRAEKKEL